MILFEMLLLINALAEVCSNPQEKFINFYVASSSETKITGTSGESNAVASYITDWNAKIPEAIWIWDSAINYNPVNLTFKIRSLYLDCLHTDICVLHTMIDCEMLQ